MTVTATSLARDVALLVDRADADATVDEALVALPAGESATFHVRTSRPDLADALTARPRPALAPTRSSRVKAVRAVLLASGRPDPGAPAIGSRT